ncbi:glutamate-5-semialdehyde dehydrogenase [Mucisphaera calidilacus]|uniref:Gamma-glutamyl phosphate reductase n=1 Tax=Mucisphaera calidilacus TaxID=2527982 RepID=A0A518BYP9_9BACT|nr:glutamate-5-semialdehyde dehydrogenase [Mucisphaera calidilacus]QDU72102.1 Gamma-glutamyl phosphate reductase [Mucisphaera calidilacus]
MTHTNTINDLQAYCDDLGRRALNASRALTRFSGADRDHALHNIAAAILDNRRKLQADNALDLDAGRANGLSSAMLDRLELTDARIDLIAESLRQVAAQPDPIGRIESGKVLPNGIRLQKRRVPIGVVLIIFESRPNVTSDAASLCLKAGNAAILRGGKEAVHSNTVIAACVREGLQAAGLPTDAVQLVETTDRAAVGHLLQMEGTIDVCVPRGGESLIRAVVEQARIPVIKHYTGNCHVYIDASADPDMAVSIAHNAKTHRTGVCNAAETLLVHQAAADNGTLKRIADDLREAGVEIRADEKARQTLPDLKPASDDDWATEYLDKIIALRIVDSLDQAIEHINRYGSRHTDAIVTTSLADAERFANEVDTANAFVNCSTRFSDGFQYGLGAEIGISTDKLHARGPMGADDLTTYKWVAYGDGQVRP